MSQLRDDVEYTSDWIREPQGRGTLSLLSTCTFTLVLCVYTAVHLNIPPAGEPRRWQLVRKIKWMLIAILAPEAVLFTAIHQYWRAWTFCREMDNLRADLGGGTAIRKKPWRKRTPYSSTSRNEEDGATSPDANAPQPPDPFSITYGFYVFMGGLTVDVSDMHNDFKTLTLSPFYVLKMARKLSDWKPFVVSDTTIQDKSKADTLAKLLVVLQVSWLFLQCVTRAGQGRPLTTLEVHTLVHAVCAMLMYGLWFNKPLDIRDATVVAVNRPEITDDLALELLRLPGSIAPSFGENGLRLITNNHRFVERFESMLGTPSLRAFVGLLPRLSESQAINF
ncbi:hypothetical protein F5X68DRAFT_239360 [Plectosphaerella plurivora]|uniref:Uncharacterized protein n=1 Tax=Plectosphaerella plurivora TaxID=936078 RepID=A0A9P9AD41_9PEZI|nr:hypothetical protein F5X68DRAFT_239360 [Plectosphaerella plurivora]